MAQFDNRAGARFGQTGADTRGSVGVDQGLRSYMLTVYNYMAGGVALTGIVAYLVNILAHTGAVTATGRLALSPFGQLIYVSPLKYVVMLAPLAFVFLLSAAVYRMSLAAAQAAFWAFAAVMGLSLSSIFLVYTGQSITQAFFVTAAAFASLSVYGYTTKRDLTGLGSFLIMGVVGLVIASLINIFLQSSMLQFAISSIGVLCFAGLTAYDTQNIKDNYYAVFHDATLAGKSAIMGALNLYLDFINLFTSLLQLMGSNRE